MSEENSTKHKIELTIRCALQTFNDRTIECPLDWTVLQLKQHLYKICSSKPEISRQRLIYAGHCLDNDQTIGSVLRRDEKGGDSCSEAPQVIHLVCVNKEMLSGSSSSSSRTANSNELRQRHNVANTVPLPNNNNNVPLNPQQFQYMPNSPEAYQNYLNQIAIQQQLLGAYNPNLYYNPYDQQQQQHAHFLNSMMMASVMGAGWPQQQLMPFGGGYGFQPAQPFMFAGGPTGGMLMGGPAGDALLPFQPNNNQFQQQQVVNLPAPPANNNNNNDEQQPDFLALIYKSIRFALLMMVLYLYSSIERFFAAIFLIGLVWFVQQQRRRHHQNPPAPIVPPGETTETPNDNNNNNANTPNQEVAMDGANLAPPPPNNRPPQSFSAWNVFWSTVTSFFASLIPENPQVPVNIN